MNQGCPPWGLRRQRISIPVTKRNRAVRESPERVNYACSLKPYLYHSLTPHRGAARLGAKDVRSKYFSRTEGCLGTYICGSSATPGGGTDSAIFCFTWQGRDSRAASPAAVNTVPSRLCAQFRVPLRLCTHTSPCGPPPRPPWVRLRGPQEDTPLSPP